MALYGVNEIVNDARLGPLTILEVFEPTENSPEQYIVLTEGGETVRTTLEAPVIPAPQEPAEAPTPPPATPEQSAPAAPTEQPIAPQEG